MSNTIGEAEGVIKYHLKHQRTALSTAIELNELNAWRSLFYRLQLIGQHPDKYQGLGFGNISRRLVPGSRQFLISGTQTGGSAILGREHYALIQTAVPEHNRIEAQGLTEPSSEALTHALIYQHKPDCQAVIHVHSPEIWRNSLRLGLPHTGAEIAYGSIEMVDAVKALFAAGLLEFMPVFSMLGHEDGIVAFGPSLPAAANCLINQLARALAVEC